MPFTVAHAVVAPPLAMLSGGRLGVAALAVGAMSPDFAYVAFLDTGRDFGHTALGVALFCLPVSLAVLALWHAVVKRPLAGLLPHRWAHLGVALSRPLPPMTWRAAGATVAAVVLGAATHVGWDSFTHPDGSAVQAFSVLRSPVPVVGRPLYVWLQYGCGVLGMVAVVAAIAVWAGRQPRVGVERQPVRQRLFGAASIAVITAAGASANVARAGAGTPPRTVDLVVAAVLGAMAGSAVAVTAYGVSQAGRGPAAAR